MRHLSLILTLLVILTPHPVMAGIRFIRHPQTAVSNSYINTPTAGQVIQGSVVVRGSATADDFQSYEIDFSYMNDPTKTWFLIQESSTPIPDGVLAVWDTTTITDGEYSLRLLINQKDGSKLEVLVGDLRVRNYSPIETDTPTPIQSVSITAPDLVTASPTPFYTPTPTMTPQPKTPTPLPTNPAVITSSQMALSIGTGAGLSIGFLALLGTYVGLRSYFRNRKNN